MSSSTGAWSSNRTHRDLGFVEPHQPVGGFNAQEARDALRKAYDGAMNEEPKLKLYRPSGKDANNAKSSPWGPKPNQMSNGKDFFLELRRQIASLQHKENTAGG